jgi:hypothetical protein
MKKLILIFVTFTSLIFISCGDEDSILNKKGLIPLKTGNTWMFENYRLDELVDTTVFVIGDYTSIDGNNGFKFTTGDQPFHVTYLSDNDIDGNFVSKGGYSDIDTLFSSSIRYKSNPLKGESWKYQSISFNESGVFSQTEIEVSCENTDTLINTPIGDFTCNVYKWSPNSGIDVFLDYISENIGWIKSEHFEDNVLFSSGILIDYQFDK